MILLIDNTPDTPSKNYYYRLVDFLKTHVPHYKIIRNMSDYETIDESDVEGIILSGSPMRIGVPIHTNKLRIAHTTKTCGCCGHIWNNVGGSKVYKCQNENCNYELDRDVHGARNILIKYYSQYGSMMHDPI